MPSALAIPVVTEQDLLAFHIKAFGRSFEVPQSTGIPLHKGFDGEVEDYEEEEDDGLGYYPDGVKRTLTDAQISIFRHSEIQHLLQKERLAREEAAATEDASEDGATQPDGKIVGKAAFTLKATASRRSSTDSSVMIENPDLGDDEAEYANFLEKERKEFAVAAQEQREKNRRSLNAGDRTVSTRRKVREMDAPAEKDVELDY